MKSNSLQHEPGLLRTLRTKVEEELLMEYVEGGNREAFSELVHRYEHSMYNYLRKYLGDAQLAEDAFQATFLQVHLKCRDFKPGAKVRPWLYAIATNQATDLLRRKRRHKAVSLHSETQTSNGNRNRSALLDFLKNDDVGAGEQTEAAEYRRLLWFAVEKLPEKSKGVILLVMYEGLKYREAAEALGIPIGTVKSRVHAALRTLRELLIALAPGTPNTMHAVRRHASTP
jgi:RNA polymerase sigma-70 factor, ECF subfamily